jgi:DNA-binding SARP family transcriptional activator
MGRFQVLVDGRPVPDAAWQHRRAAELIKLLALADAHRAHSEWLQEEMFAGLAPAAAAANLRKAVHYARTALGSPDALRRHDEFLELCNAVVDAEDFEQRALQALHRMTSVARAAATYGGDLLPEDRYAPWAEAHRSRLRALHIQLLKAGGMWEEVLDKDPGDEDAHRGLMQRALDLGDRQGALRIFERLRERLRADLGVGPSVASVALYEQALALDGEEPAVEERAHALIARALIALNASALDEAERLASEARSMSLAAGLPRETGEASAVLGIAANARGRWPEHFREEFLATMREDPDVTSKVFDAHRCLAEYCLYGERGHEPLGELGQELMELAEQERSIQGQALASLLIGEVSLLSGRLEEASVALTRAVDLHAQAGAESGEVLSLQRVAELALTAGHRPDRQVLSRGLTLSGRAWLRPHVEVRMLGVLVEAAPAPRRRVILIQQADEALSGSNVCPTCSIGFHLAAARAFASAGSPDQARGRLELSERLARLWPSGGWHAAVWETRGVLYREMGDHSQAAAMFREAASQYDELARPRDRDRCRAAGTAALPRTPPR